MLIMTYAYAHASGDGSLISSHVRQYSNYFLPVIGGLIDSDSIRC